MDKTMDQTLEALRKQIDGFDEQLLTALSKRMDIVRKIGKLKKENNIPPLDEERWHEVLKTKLLLGQTLNIPQELVEKIFTAIHEASLEEESKSP